MSDHVDRAAELEQRHRDAALAAQRRRAAGAVTSAVDCEDCGETIPEPRRRAVPGCTRCIDCETAHERVSAT